MTPASPTPDTTHDSPASSAYLRPGRLIVVCMLAFCALPFLALVAGLPFDTPNGQVYSSEGRALDEADLNTAAQGTITHTILEWVSATIAILAACAAFVLYSISRKPLIALVSVLMGWAGASIAVHILGAAHLIGDVPTNEEFATVTQLFARIVYALIGIVGGVLVLRLGIRRGPWSPLVIVAITIVALFGAIGMFVLFAGPTSDLPTLLTPDATLKRPGEILMGPLWLLLALVTWRIHRQQPSVVTLALLMSFVPVVLGMIAIAFVSNTLYDAGYNFAHTMQIGIFMLPLLGVLLEFAQSFRRQEQLTDTVRHQREAADALFENAFEAIVGVDTEGVIRKWNRKAQSIYGYTRQEAVGRQAAEIMFPASRQDELAETFREFLESGTADFVNRGKESLMMRKDGTEFAGEISVTPVREGDEWIYHGFVRDIGELKAADQALKRHAAELERSNGQLQEFAYVASHDLQEPLRVISSFLQMLELDFADKLDVRGRDYVENALLGSQRMQALISDLLAYSKVDINPKLEVVPLASVMSTALADLRAAMDETGATVVCDDELPEVQGSRTLLTQLFVNLLQNAIKYRADEPPCIVVHVEPAASTGSNGDGPPGQAMWHVSVSDNGIGIDPRYAERIFRVFERLHPQDAYEGTGIGLAIAAKIAATHCGRIWVTGAPGEGSTFHVTLPATGTSRSASPSAATLTVDA